MQMRYFFHVFDNGDRIADEVGVLLADDATARAEAARFLTDLAREMIAKAGVRSCDVEVLDEAGRKVATLGFSLRQDPGVGRR